MEGALAPVIVLSFSPERLGCRKVAVRRPYMQVPEFWLGMPDRLFCLRKEIFPQLHPGVISNTAHLSSLIFPQQSNKEKRIERAPQEAEETPQEIP